MTRSWVLISIKVVRLEWSFKRVGNFEEVEKSLLPNLSQLKFIARLTNFESKTAKVTRCGVARAFAFDIVKEVSIAWLCFADPILHIAIPAGAGILL